MDLGDGQDADAGAGGQQPDVVAAGQGAQGGAVHPPVQNSGAPQQAGNAQGAAPQPGLNEGVAQATGGGPGVVQPQGGPQLPGISAAELAAAFAAQVQGQGGPGQGVQGGPPLPALNPGINTAQLAAALAAQLAGQGIQPPGPAVPGAQHNQGDGAPPVPNASNMGNAGVVQPQLDLDAEEQSIAEEVARNPESEIKEANIYKPQRDYQHLGFEDMETG